MAWAVPASELGLESRAGTEPLRPNWPDALPEAGFSDTLRGEMGCRPNPLYGEPRCPRSGRLLAGSVALALFALTPALASAEEDVQAASAAFAEGQRAQLRGDFPRAAELFEIADQAAPSPGALRSAIRNREAAGQDVRAATLALRAIERYGDDRETRAVADATVARLAGRLARVRVRCGEPCTLTVDGGLVSSKAAASTEFFAASGTHTVEARWAGREAVSKAFEGAPGQTVTQDLRPPPPSTTPPATSAAVAPTPSPTPAPAAGEPAPTTLPAAYAEPHTEEQPSGSHHGLPPAVFWVGTGLTVVAGGFLTWSGLNTLSARDRYEKNPTRAGFDDGQGRESRTNVLAVTTAVLGAATIAVGLFATDWGHSQVGLGVGQDRVALSLSGTLP